jgi:hypothetical protein
MKPRLKIAVALYASTLALTGCYVVPVVDPQGNVQNYHYPLPPAGVPVAVAPGAFPAPAQGGSFPVVLNARLYPDNDIATRTRGHRHGGQHDDRQGPLPDPVRRRDPHG